MKILQNKLTQRELILGGLGKRDVIFAVVFLKVMIQVVKQKEIS